MDIEEDSWCLDPNSLLTNLEKFTENKKGECIHSDTGRRVAAIMPVHTLGHPADMDEIVQIGQNYEIPVIADAAAALGAKYKSEPMGTLGAELAVFSFNGNKTITSGGGGAICSDNDSLLKHIKHLSTTARSSDKYDHDEVGFNYRITNIEAAVGCAQMERICEFIRIKRMIRDSYNEALGNVNGVSLFPEAEWAESAAWFSGIVIESDNYGTMDMIRTMLRENNIDARPFWKPVHLQVPYKHSIKEDLSVTESIWDRVLTLPCSTGLTKDEQDYVISAVLKILKR
jgi:predicted outer membrane repeat protein